METSRQDILKALHGAKVRDEVVGRMAHSDEAFHIAFGVDDAFVEPMVVCALSVQKHHPQLKFVFHVIIARISDANLARLHKTADERQLCFVLHFVDTSLFDSFDVDFFYTKAIYNRFLIPYLLPEPIERVLYLDADILCFGDLSRLWEISFGNHLLGAVADELAIGVPHAGNAEAHQAELVQRMKALGFSCEHYFNTGVLLINLPGWRSKELSVQALASLFQYKERFPLPDQDALNSVLPGQVIFLPQKYNAMYSVQYAETPVPDLEKICLLHYTSRYKLWQAWCAHPLQKLYLALRAETAWRDEPLMQPRNYKEMRSMGKMLWQKHQYLAAVQWYMRFIREKYHYKTQKNKEVEVR